MKTLFLPFLIFFVVLLGLSLPGYSQKVISVASKGHSIVVKVPEKNQAAKPGESSRPMGNAYLSLTLTRQSQIDSFPINYPGTSIVQDLSIDGKNATPKITNLDSLKYITAVNGMLYIGNTQITDLHGLSGLQSVGYLYFLDTDTLLTGIKPPNISYINGLLLQNIPLFTSFSGFLNGLTNTSFDVFQLFNDVGITDFNGLQGVDSISQLGCFGLPNFQSFNGLQNLHHCGGIEIWGNGQLTDVTALSNISQLPDYSLTVSYNYSLTSLIGLQNIESIGGVLNIQGTNFSSLSETGLNPNLVINGSNSGDTLLISDNANMSVCNWPPLCNYLNTGKPANIHDNSTGCSSTSEVQSNCSVCAVVGLKTWNGSVSSDWNNGSNWVPAGVPGTCDSVVVNSVDNQPQLSANVFIHALTANTATISLNGYNLAVNGDVNMDNSTLSSSGCGCETFSSTNGNVINISNSQVEMQNVLFSNYQDSLVLINNYFDNDVVISDGPNRLYNYISGNTFGSLNYTSNSVNINAYSDMSGNGNDDYINGDFTINIAANESSNSFIVGDGNQVHIAGNLIVNNNISNANYLVLNDLDFITGNNGVNDSHITQTGSQPIVIQNLSTSKSPIGEPFAHIILDQNVYVDGQITLGSGLFNTTPSHLLILNPGAGFSSWGDGSWVWGPLKVMSINGNSTQMFTVGDSIWRGETYLLNTTAGNLNNGFVAQYFHRNPSLDGYDTTQRDPSLKVISGNEYWRFSQDNPGGSLKVKLRYEPGVSQPTNSFYGIRVARWNGSMWKDNGAAAIDSGGWAVITPDSLSVFPGIYTLGYLAHYKKPVITIQTSDTMGCSGSYVMLRWKVDSLMFSNSQFSAYLSDSSGNFTFNSGSGYFLGSKVSNRSDSMIVQLPPGFSSGNKYLIRIVGSQPSDTSINTWPIKILQKPLKSLSIVGPTNVCSQIPTKYYVGQRDSSATSYNWVITGGIFTQNLDTVIVTWSNPPSLGYQGHLSVNATNTCGNGLTTTILPTVSYPPPTDTPVVFNLGRKIFISNPSSNSNFTTNWYRNSSLVSGANANSYYASLAGTYNMNYSTGCASGPLSNTINFAANSVAQSLNFPAIASHQFGDAPFALLGTSTSGLPVVYSILSGPGSIQGNIYTVTGIGTVTIQASQPGDNTYDTAAYVTQTFQVNKANQSITFAPLANMNYTTVPFTLTGSASSNLPLSYNIVSGPATVSGNSVTLTGVGTVTIQATQSGNSTYNAATSVVQSFCVQVPNLNPISGANSICPGTPTLYSVNTIPGATYTWRIAGGSTLASTTNSATVTWPSPGSYTLLVNANGSCGAPGPTDSLLVTAISSVKPDSVNNMLPANGSVNLQLPLNLSWIPANPNLYYTYDLYIWKVGDPQPSTPFASGITSVHYVVPINSGLTYGIPYNWMVVAHNGSCTQINTGLIQQFTLAPLPDLAVYNVQAPSSVFSGQNLTVTWSVKNIGPGNTQTSQKWADAVFLSKDSVLNLFNVNNLLQFPVVPLLGTTVQNVSGLNNGQSYNSSASVQVPVSYSGPLYVHIVTNYNPPSTNPVIETTYANDTAHALPVTTVTLSPQPDLQVDTVFNPTNLFSGNAVSITYKVHNHGQAAATGNWQDKIYISQDPLFNPATATLLKFKNYWDTYYVANDAIVSTNNKTILPDSSMVVTANVVIPNFIYGSYYLYVFTNANGTIYEGANNNNNVNHGPLMQVYLTATPKIVPFNIRVADTLSNTQTSSIGWTDNNQGAYDNIQKNKGHYVVTRGTCPSTSIPNLQDSLGFGASYWVDGIYLSTDSTGLNMVTATKIGDFNQGLINSGYLVNDGPYTPVSCGASPAYPGRFMNTWPVLNPNASFPSTYNFNPINLAQGSYYIYVYTNTSGSVYEYPGLPQIARSNKFTVVWPDLTVPSVTVPATGNSGQPITINYNLSNAGPGILTGISRKDYIYLGNNPAFDGTAILIDSVTSATAVGVNQSVALQKQTVLPNGISGTKYIFVKVNVAQSFNEISFANNTNVAGAPINIGLSPSPNFSVSGIYLGNPVFSSTGFPIKYTVANTGVGTVSGTWNDSLFISCNSTFNPATAYFVGVRTQQLYVPSGGSYSDSFNLTVPLTYSLINATGCMLNDTIPNSYFFVKSNANGGVFVASSANNTGVSSAITFINRTVDLIVSNVQGQSSAQVGRPYKIKWSTQNIGLNPNDYSYQEWADRIWFSTDSVINNNSIYLGQNWESTRLNHNQLYSDSVIYTIPNISAGNYYLLVQTNASKSISAERNLGNNLNLLRDVNGQALKVNVSVPAQPDLVDTILSVPTSVAIGQPFKVVYKVTNVGQAVNYTNVWNDVVWLNTNFQVSNPLLSGNYEQRTLLPGQSYIDSFIITLPLNFTGGNYIVGVNTNYNRQMNESDFTNNSAFNYVSVYLPSPVDLVVNNINIADTVILGNKVVLNYALLNNSNYTATGLETDGIYLSTDSTLASTSDILVGTQINNLNIWPQSSSAISANPYITGVTEGSYYVKVKADILNNIPETNKGNNSGVYNKQVYVKVKQLFINIPAADTLADNYLYYKLVVPTALKRKTILVQLTTPDSLIANNQMYIGLGYLPSAAHFDYVFNKPSFGNQNIVIETVVDSVYYIAVTGKKSVGGAQAVALQAVVLPFSVLAVNSNTGGNTGNVTVMVTGSLFSDSMTAILHPVSGGTDITSSAVYFVNSTSAYVTFNLKGAALGLYSVSLTKTDASVATLPSSFTVQATNNGGLLTGGGGNTGSGDGNTPGCNPGAASGLNSQLQTEIVLPPKVFVGWPFQIQINYTNTTNVDIPVQVRTLYSQNGAPVSLTQSGLSNGTNNLTIEFKSSVIPGNIIPAGSSGTITIWSKAPADAHAHEKIYFNLQ